MVKSPSGDPDPYEARSSGPDPARSSIRLVVAAVVAGVGIGFLGGAFQWVLHRVDRYMGDLFQWHVTAPDSPGRSR